MKVGDIVCLTILDHCIGTADTTTSLIEFEVHGRVIDVQKDQVAIAHWLQPKEPIDHNTEVSIVIRSAIKKVRRLR